MGELFENDRHFSHLSTLEREMAFRTEMGLYYSHYKTVAVEADSFIDGVFKLTEDRLTEYPHKVNTLKRFNVYPEVVLGGLFRMYDYVSGAMNWRTKSCWKINRGDHLAPVFSCDGLGDPHNFYISCVWLVSAFSAVFIFLLGAEIGDSVWGGIISALFFFYNHGECTRVQWTPSLRESFGYPVCIAQHFFVSLFLRHFPASSKSTSDGGNKIKKPNSAETDCSRRRRQTFQVRVLQRDYSLHVSFVREKPRNGERKLN